MYVPTTTTCSNVSTYIPSQPGTGLPVTPGVGFSFIPRPTQDAVIAQPVSESQDTEVPNLLEDSSCN